MRSLFALLAVLFAANCASPHASPSRGSPSQTATVTVQQGQLAGVVLENGVRAFMGIPYAAAPTGANRWRPPASPPSWAGQRDASAFGPACVQPVLPATSIYADPPPAMSEDCLSLNVWAPQHARNLPVMVWIHGGAQTYGYTGSPLYDGRALAQHGVIVVSVNYRLGVLGYLALAELSAESPHGSSGNYGLLDQIESLRWVRANIAAFGGDAHNVTIFGESAGAMSVVQLLMSPLARGLFEKAITESGGMPTLPLLNRAANGLPSAEALGASVESAAHAPDLAALRAMDAHALTDAAIAAHYPVWSTVDGWVLPHQTVDAYDAGEQAHVPVLAGFNGDEIKALFHPPMPANAQDYVDDIRAKYGDLADAFLALYPRDDVHESVERAMRDGAFGWGMERLARKQTAIGAPVYFYLFDHTYPAAAPNGAFHGIEIPYVFGRIGKPAPQAWPAAPLTPSETQLSETLMTYWTNFARSGAPGAVNGVTWPRYDGAAHYLAFDDGVHVESDPMHGAYALHEEAMCRRRAAGNQSWIINTGFGAQLLPPPSALCKPA